MKGNKGVTFTSTFSEKKEITFKIKALFGLQCYKIKVKRKDGLFNCAFAIDLG